MNDDSLAGFFERIFPVLGILAAVGLVGYGLTQIIVMPKVSPDGFIPTTLEISDESPSQFGTLQATFVLLYAFAFLPVNVMYTIQRYSVNPHALVFASCLTGVSSLIEIVNNLPVVAAGIYPTKLESISSDVLLYLNQVESIRYLSYDVAGFTMAYVAFFVYAIVYFRSHRWLSYTIIGSIVLFVANVPCLWFAPGAAVILMAVSIFACAPVPIFLARKAIE